VIGLHGSPIVRFAARVQAPLLQLYALYVLAHGHYGPGGGFQAGAALAASYLLPRIAEGVEEGSRGLSTRAAMLLAVGGVLVYGAVGLLSLLLGGAAFLDYSGLARLPWPMPDGAAARAVGTLTVEVGVAMAVMGVMITLYDDLVAGAGEEA
jgi:multicomponent Na+:H+ antiporter subunit B